MEKNTFTKALTSAAHNMPSPSKEEKDAIEGLLTDAFNSMTVNKCLLYAFRLGMAFRTMKYGNSYVDKLTPSNCKLKRCEFNAIAPQEKSQECFACGNNIKEDTA